jgi:hypothetical protein
MTGPEPSAAPRPRIAPSRARAGTLLALLASFALAVAACGGSASIPSTDDNVEGQAVEAPAAAPASGASGAEEYRAAADQATGDALAVGGPLIVRTGRLDLEVAVLDDALTAAEKAVAAAGGYVAASERRGDGETASALVTYRIPAERWEATLAAVRAVGSKVLAEQTSSDEVTAQVVDLGARLANLRATEAALQEIMTKATKIPDILEVQAQLTTVRQEIEQLAAQKASLEQRAALATLAVSFALPPVVAVTQVREGWDPASEVDRAAATLVGLGQGLASAAIWVGIVVLPLALLVLLGAGAAWLVVRRVRPRPTVGPGPAAPDAPAA